MNDPVFPEIKERSNRARPHGRPAAGGETAGSRNGFVESCWRHCLEAVGAGEAGLQDILDGVERGVIRSVLIRTGGNQSRACRILSIKPSTLSFKIRKLGLDTEFGRHGHWEAWGR